MAVNQDALFYAEDFVSLKATLKQEMQRRGKTEGAEQGQSQYICKLQVRLRGGAGIWNRGSRRAPQQNHRSP